MPRDYEPEKQCPAQVTLATRASKVPSPLQSRFAIAYNVGTCIRERLKSPASASLVSANEADSTLWSSQRRADNQR